MSTPPSPNTSLRPFSTPSYLIVDNFYEFPDDIRTFALSQTFHLHTNYHKGHRTNDSFHFPGIQKRFESLLGRRIDNWHKYSTNACFQYCIAGDQLVYHFDFQQYAAIIFLSPNAPPHSGTSLFRSKITLNMKVSDNEISTVFKHGYLDSSQFDIVDKIGNVYNRLLIFDAKNIHAASDYFGNSKENGRLFQLFFFDLLPII